MYTAIRPNRFYICISNKSIIIQKTPWRFTSAFYNVLYVVIQTTPLIVAIFYVKHIMLTCYWHVYTKLEISNGILLSPSPSTCTYKGSEPTTRPVLSFLFNSFRSLLYGKAPKSRHFSFRNPNNDSDINWSPLNYPPALDGEFMYINRGCVDTQ